MHLRVAAVPLLVLAMFAPVSRTSDVILVQNSQYNGQYSGQYSGQSSGQWSGQVSGRWSGQYVGQRNPPAPITLTPGPVDNRGDPNASVDGRDLNTFSIPSNGSGASTMPCWSVMNAGSNC